MQTKSSLPQPALPAFALPLKSSIRARQKSVSVLYLNFYYLVNIKKYIFDKMKMLNSIFMMIIKREQVQKNSKLNEIVKHDSRIHEFYSIIYRL